MKILMVTRETQADRRYGLGRSLTPLIDEFHRRNIRMDYACQIDLGVKALRWQRKLGLLLPKLFAKFDADTDFPILIHVILERLNMGRIGAKIAAKQGHTHVHCHDPIIAAGFRLFAHFYPCLKARWGVTEHGFGCYTDAIHADGVRLGARTLSWMRRWEARTMRKASWVVSPTRSAMKEVAVSLNINPIPPTWRCIYHARPRLTFYTREESRRRLGWEAEVFYIMGIGRIAPVKQFPMIIEACSHLKKTPPVQLVILGDGDYASMLAVGKQHGLSRDILFAVADDISLYLHAADLYVSASASESFGLANLEAMTAGLAAVCTAVGGVAEVVGDGAQLVAPETEALTNAIQRLIEDETLRKLSAQNGLRRAEAWPDIVEIANQYEEIYQKMAANSDKQFGSLPAA